ncbi:unnamed protein product [Calypogeia fissa]
MSYKQYHCRNCWDVGKCVEAGEVTVVPKRGCSYNQLEMWGCPKCKERHKKEVTDLNAEVKYLRVDSATKIKLHETEVVRIKAESSFALSNEQVEYLRLQARMKDLQAENTSQRRMVEFLKLGDSLRGNVISAGGDLHASVLVAKSPKLQKLLETESAEKLVREFTSDDIPTPVLEAMMDFCHSGELTFSKLVPPAHVLRAAHFLEIGFLKEFCEAELCERLSVDNVSQILKLSQKFSATKLQEEAEMLFMEHFDVLKTRRSARRAQDSGGGELRASVLVGNFQILP